MVPIDEVVHFDVTTHRVDTGGVSDADSPPTFDVFEEATDTPVLDDQAMTKRTGLTGNYRGSFTASAANGFEAGKWYSVVATAAVNSVTAKAVAMTFRVAPAETAAGVPKVDVSHFGGAAGTFAAGLPTANLNMSQTPPGFPIDGTLGEGFAWLADDDHPVQVFDIGAQGQSAIRTAVGLASPNLDSQLGDLPTNAELATALGTADDAVLAAIAALNNVSAAQVATAVLTTAMTEAYRSAGATATLAQFAYEVLAHLGDHSNSGTTRTLRKLDGTTAKTFTYDDALLPTSITEAT